MLSSCILWPRTLPLFLLMLCLGCGLAAARPDLVVTDVQIEAVESMETGPRVVSAGHPHRLIAVVENHGASPTPAGVVHGVVFSVDDVVVSWSDTWIESVAPGERVFLAASGSPGDSPWWTPSRAGGHRIEAVVDERGLIEERDEANNTFASSVEVQAVDLRPAMIQLGYAARAGEPMRLSALIENLGDPVRPNVTPRATFLVDGQKVGEAPVQFVWFPVMLGGVKADVVEVVAETEWLAQPGERVFTVIIDLDGEVIERDKSNNRLDQTLAVLPSGGPDLVISELGTNPQIVFENQWLEPYVKLTNQGDQPTPAGVPHRVDFYYEGELRAWSSGWTSSIAPGESVTLTADGGPVGRGGWYTPGGVFLWEARVDPRNAIAESRETNNRRVALVYAGFQRSANVVTQPDLVVEEIAWTPELPQPGESVRFSAVVTNRRLPSPADSTLELEFYIDGQRVATATPRTGVVDFGERITMTAEQTWIAEEGRRQVVAVVNPRERIGEGLFWNNTASAQIETRAPQQPAAQPVPDIVAQPGAVTVNAGDSATFRVQASGSGSLRYQWRRDGYDVAGATTPELVINPALAGDAGSYSVAVSSEHGTTLSAAARLTVLAPDLVVEALRIEGPDTIKAGDPLRFWATVRNVGEAPSPSGVVHGVSFWVNGVAVSWSDRWTQGLAPGEAVELAADGGPSGSSVWMAEFGNHEVTAWVDDLNRIPTESNVDNNRLTMDFAVAAAAGPRLRLSRPSGQVRPGRPLTLSFEPSGAGPFTFEWRRNGERIAGASQASLRLESVDLEDAGSYTLTVSSPAGSFTTEASLVSVAYSRLLNLSARSMAGGESRPLIAGMVVAGESKLLLMRGIGPGLRQFGVDSTMADPHLRVFRGEQVLAENQAWSESPDPAAIAAAGRALGAFALADHQRDAAALMALPAGPFTAHLFDAAGPGGIGLQEVYDAEPGIAATRLVNLSVRGAVEAGDGALIAGFVVDGNEPIRLLARAVGPGLQSFEVAGFLPRVRIELRRGDTLVAANAGWSTNPDAAAISAAAAAVGAFALDPGSADAALLVDLPPGVYTAVVTGPDGATGEALVELYEVPQG
jgi:hypothetical protein